ncbi:MAG TPA: pantoate--beta-alanine ligase [Polyangiaceae bacterium]
MTQLVHEVELFRTACESARRAGSSVGLIPTMGALHSGHASLMRQSRDAGRFTAVTIFVNPTQFGPNEDFERYPRTLAADHALCSEIGVDVVFAPSVASMYPEGDCSRVTVSRITEGLCGQSRPGHFDGVTTIVAKLFAVAGPSVAYFGKKDYQQYRVIERMARDLLLPVTVVGCPTVREPDGLALSSRNRYLSVDERARALGIARGLVRAHRAFAAAERRPDVFMRIVRQELQAADLQSDYVALRDAFDLAPLEAVEQLPERTLLAVAAFCGKTRLIDNIVLGEAMPSGLLVVP